MEHYTALLAAVSRQPPALHFICNYHKNSAANWPRDAPPLHPGYIQVCAAVLWRAVTEGFYAELLLPLESKYVEQTRHKLVAHNNMVELNSNFNIHIYTGSTS